MPNLIEDKYAAAKASLVATEEVQITVHVRGDFTFVFSDFPLIPSFQDLAWNLSWLDSAEARLNFSEVGIKMLQQLLSLHNAMSLKATPHKISVTFSFVNREFVDLDYFRRQTVANIAFYLPEMEATQ